jgi:hypothetical protein
MTKDKPDQALSTEELDAVTGGTASLPDVKVPQTNPGETKPPTTNTLLHVRKAGGEHVEF